jgi:hypothetical protein
MSEIDPIVQVTISRQTQSVKETAFGIPGIIAEFATSKTTPAFDRYREYGELQELLDDGWLTTDAVYQKASIEFSQNPAPATVIVGRKDAADADWATALGEINKANSDWYAFTIDRQVAAKLAYDADFVSLNNITVTVNATTTSGVVFTTDQATTIAAVAAQIESEVAGAKATVDPDDATSRTIIIELFGEDITVISSAVTLGASQATATGTLLPDYDANEVAAWTETQKKIFGYDSKDADIKDAGATTDIAYILNAAAYDRTFVNYYPYDAAQAANEMMADGWIGETAPYDPGSQTWMFKTIAGLLPYELTSGEKTAVHGKKANTYTTVAGVNITEQGTVASGEYIDIIRGLDWLESRIQTLVFTELINARKIPYTDGGIAIIEGALRAALDEGVQKELLDGTSITVTVPKIADISVTDKSNRLLPDMNFTARLQGAVHKVEINGVVTV